MKKFIIHCTETVSYEILVEAENSSHAKELFYANTLSETGNEVNGEFVIDKVEEIN